MTGQRMPRESDPDAGEPTTLSVEFALDYQDLLAFNVYTLYESPARSSQRWTGRLILPVGFLIVAFFLFLWNDLPTEVRYSVPAVLLALSVGWFLFHPWMMKRRYELVLRGLVGKTDDPDLFGVRRLTIQPQALTQAGEISATTRKWTGIQDIVIWKQYAFFYINAMTAFIIPKRAFANERAFDEFIDAARHFHRGAADYRGL